MFNCTVRKEESETKDFKGLASKLLMAGIVFVSFVSSPYNSFFKKKLNSL